MATDVNLLLEESRCLDCLTPGQMAYIGVSLLDTWAVSASAFTPESIPEYVGDALRWFDAGSFTGLDDEDLIAASNPWTDKTFHQDAVTTSGKEPTYKIDIFGARPAVRFGEIKHMVFGLVTLTDFTILAVVKAAVDSIFLSRQGLNRQVRVYRQNENTLSIVPSAEVISDVISAPFSDAKMIGYRRVSATGVVSFFENAAAFGADGTNIQVFTLDQIGLAQVGQLGIDIAELAIYDSIVSDEDIAGLYNAYFKPKYGLP